MHNSEYTHSVNEEGMNYWYTHAKHLVALVRTRRAHQPILLIAFRISLFAVGFVLRCIQYLSLTA